MSDEENEVFSQRRIIHRAVQEAYSDSVIGGWVLIFERLKPADDDTSYSLEVASGDATGESDLRPWTARGWCAVVGSDEEYFDYIEEDENDESGE